MTKSLQGFTGLLTDVRALIESARANVARAVNSGLVMLYWEIGRRVRQDILHNKRAGYGEKILPRLAEHLTREYGRGFQARSLARMIRLVEVFPERQILSTLLTKLGWSHFIQIIPLKDPLQRDFYAEMCRVERWDVRTLHAKIAGQLYERTALSRQPARLASLELKKLRDEDRMTPDLVFRDPYHLDFLGLRGVYQEKDLEAAILREMESFLLEFGSGFSFVARQLRIQVGPDDFHLDLLFFHRDLRRLVAIELKLDRFRPEHKGQMEFYLNWLAKHERRPGEKAPIGLILCAGKSEEQVELLKLDKSGIRVAQYLTDLPPRSVLEARLHRAIRLARESGAGAS
ncbi:MAG: PDDEXK nuclease domain-containing protein [Elusimicrobiota bacterium]